MKRRRKPKLASRPRDVPADAGASYLGAYGFRNVWTAWLLRNEPGILAAPPSELHRTDVGDPPECPAPARVLVKRRGKYVHKVIDEPCGEKMKYRPGAWCCYHHDETVRLPTRPKYDRAVLHDAAGDPVHDVLSLIAEAPDVMLIDGRWTLVKARRGRR